MIPIIEFQERALRGPVMKVDEFDMEFAMKVRELVAKYDIKYNPEEFIVDDATADAVYQAGVELLADIGLLHLDTERVINYTKEEIEAYVQEWRENPAKVVLGKGKDEITIQYRTSTDINPPVLYSGPSGVAQEEWFAAYAQSFAQEPTVSALGIVAGLDKLGEIRPKAGTLSEIYVGHWEQAQLKEMLRKVDRPDMHCGLLATVSTAAGIMAMVGDFRGPKNTHIGVHVIPEQKLNWNQLVMAQFCQDQGIVPWQSSMSLIGGLCRNAADAAVGMIANLLGQLSYAHGPLCSIFTNHMDGKFGTPQTIWATSAAMRAAERNIKIAIGGCARGRGTRPVTGLLQSTAQAIANTASGLEYLWIGGFTGLEARYLGEAMDAVAGMPRNKASALVSTIMAQVETKFGDEVKVKSSYFAELYDVETVQPKTEYADALKRAKEELARLGVPYP
ncbi:monomethylamine:corrinoid methyltransferase [Neptuniibacter sp.]|uniref:monomethylamine:corrinoid methyltransferase n=1 Tax=Neptuniibacter sp. TaxID=1962643 RepID=UPI00260B0A47|nr:monomethylamine:corrinoid methyltransferase [Neptuniibacter sp.]MCP4595991.1 monomethylamine:corrinoid methyltransferase [Neptuniibacter sp.]